MSLRLALARALARLLVKPRLAGGAPEQARRDFERGARLLPPPPFLLRLRVDGAGGGQPSAVGVAGAGLDGIAERFDDGSGSLGIGELLPPAMPGEGPGGPNPMLRGSMSRGRQGAAPIPRDRLPAPVSPRRAPVPLHRITAGPVDERAVILWFHGGAYVAGSPATHAAMLGRLARLSRLAVIAPDYRLAPGNPAPAAFEDACAAHAALIAAGWAPDRIVLGGDSAGGGLALALLAHLGRDRRPAAAAVFSPWTDLTLSGESLRVCAAADPLLPVARIVEAVGMVRGDLPPGDPRLSPLLAEFAGPPPVLIQCGADEILRDDSRRMAARLREAGAEVVLEEMPKTLHVWQILDGLVPEAREALRRAARFCADHAGAPEISR